MANVNTKTREAFTLEMAQEVIAKHESTSAKVRALFNQGLKVAEVYKMINAAGVTTKGGGEIRYQHVRNIIVQEFGKAGLKKND